MKAFVSGHGFSRAVMQEWKVGFSPFAAVPGKTLFSATPEGVPRYEPLLNFFNATLHRTKLQFPAS
jgi:hypothetical protein